MTGHIRTHHKSLRLILEADSCPDVATLRAYNSLNGGIVGYWAMGKVEFLEGLKNSNQSYIMNCALRAVNPEP